MMGVSISGPTFIYGDNMSVIHNTQTPESTLKKKSNAICYHAVRESVAMGESLTAHIPSDRNVADLLTKLLYGQKRKSLVSEILFEVLLNVQSSLRRIIRWMLRGIGRVSHFRLSLSTQFFTFRDYKHRDNTTSIK